MKNIKTWLYDILNAIVEIDSFFKNRLKVLLIIKTTYEPNGRLKEILRLLGEATNKTLKLGETIAISSSKKLVDVRNRIIHGYDSVSDDMIWGIVIKHLPILKIEVSNLLMSTNFPR